MQQRTIDWIFLGISIGCFLCMCVSFLLMPIEKIGILPGLMFWLGLALGSAFQVVLAFRYKARPGTPAAGQQTKTKRIGLISFSSNVPAMIADGTMAAGAVATALAFVMTKGYGYVCYIFIALTIFSFCMHCVLNGKVYFFLTRPTGDTQDTKQTGVNSTDKGESKQ